MGTSTQPSDSAVKILIAEDSATQAQRLRHILEQQGYEVGVAANGRLALEMARQFAPALIISDVVMPEMDGYELSRQVKADPGLGHIPVILVTTLSDPQDVIRGLECRADNFILKPYDEHYLLSRLQFVLLNRGMRDSERMGIGVEVVFNGQKHFITADRLQILNLLLSTYDAAIQRNKELKRSQDELQVANAKLEAANKELESFSYSVSHDLRAPLRAIDGYTRMVLEDHAATLPPEGQRLLNVVREQTKKMSSLIDDLLELARLGRRELGLHPVKLGDLVRNCWSELRAEQAGRTVELAVGELPAWDADRILLKQLFLNLLSNALKYTRKRAAARIEIGAERRGAEEVVFVRDNGTGFDMARAEKLFGVFQRLHAEEEYPGTGVGLAIVRRVAERHGARVWAEAIPDGGATFYVAFPAAPG